MDQGVRHERSRCEFVGLSKMIYAKKQQMERGRQEANKLLHIMAKKQILKLTMESIDGKVTEKEKYTKS